VALHVLAGEGKESERARERGSEGGVETPRREERPRLPALVLSHKTYHSPSLPPPLSLSLSLSLPSPITATSIASVASLLSTACPKQKVTISYDGLVAVKGLI